MAPPRKDLPPTTAGGGTVIYVGFKNHDFSEDIETREKAGTPPILQAIKAALVLELKEKIGVKTIEEVERVYTKYFIEGLKKIENVELLGDIASDERVSIVSLNIQHKDRILHPRFVAKLLNDLFGIQSRAGCSCAGPYGHILLGIDQQTSEKYRRFIVQGCEGIKPGWVRVNIHYTLSRDDVEFILHAIEFVARAGHLFLQKYVLNMKTAEWNYIGFTHHVPAFSLDETFRQHTISPHEIPFLRIFYLKEAEMIAESLKRQVPPPYIRDEDSLNWAALGYGIAAATVNINHEYREPKEKQRSAEWFGKQQLKIDRSLAVMERDLGHNEFCFGPRFTLADIAAGYALAYLDYALPDVEWRSTHPALAKLAARLAARPAFTNNGHAASR